ncbi:hypothetical protein [Celerinatantimonas sp. YJH-8]|uniref:hypothetical protein n=1 Tax=Celerinatantimonas sp. YJH-8 TaxID=3228714 RepID=UPI0038CC0400
MKRRIRLENVAPEQTSALATRLRQIPQIHQVDHQHQWLRISYDARFYEISQVLKQLDQWQIPYQQGFWARRRYQRYQNTDHQARENSAIIPYCCDKVAIRKENL